MTLSEDTTKPVDDRPELTEELVSEELSRFLRHRLYSFLQRMCPSVDRIEDDEELGVKHIWLKTSVAVENPSEATIQGVTSELNQLIDRLSYKIKQPMALSIVLDKQKEQ